MDNFYSFAGLVIAICSPLFIWVIRVEIRLAELCKDVKFLKEHIVAWNVRRPV